MYRITARGFGESDGSCVPFLDLMPTSGVSNLWQRKQQESLEEYFAEEKAAPESIGVLYDLFAGYIARAIHGRSNLRILDVGCGVRSDYPPYVAFLSSNNRGHLYVGLDPIQHNLAGRSYLFICGRLEDLPRMIDQKFDVFLFSTSLDHVESIETAASVVRRLASDQALCLIWAGMHDPSSVATEIGAKWFRGLFTSLNPMTFAMRYLYVVAGAGAQYFMMLRRQIRLKLGKPIDALHFYHFTRQSFTQTLSLFGEIRDVLSIPGTNSLFATVAVRNTLSS